MRNVFSFHITSECVDILNHCILIRKGWGFKTLLLTLRLSMQMAAVTTGSGQISEITWEENMYFSFEITNDV